MQSLVEDDFRQFAHDLFTTSPREVVLGSLPQCRQSRYGLRGVRIGEASNPGPLSDDVGGSLAEEEFLDQFEQDLMSGRRRRVRRRVVDSDSDTSLEGARTDGGIRRPSRRVVLVPGSEDGTPQSIQDRVPSTVSGSCEIPTTIVASSCTVRKLVGVQSRPPTEFISSDEEPLVRSDEGTENTCSLRSEDANRDARPTEVDCSRFEETSDVVDSTLGVPVEFLDGVPAPGNAEMVSGPNLHVPDIRIDDVQLSTRRGSRRLVLNSQNMPVAHVEDVLDSHTERLARVRHVLLQDRIDFQQRQASGVAHVHIGTPTDESASEGVTSDEESEAGEPEVSVPDEETAGEVAVTHRRQSSESHCSPWMKLILVLCLNKERQS